MQRVLEAISKLVMRAGIERDKTPLLAFRDVP